MIDAATLTGKLCANFGILRQAACSLIMIDLALEMTAAGDQSGERLWTYYHYGIPI